MRPLEPYVRQATQRLDALHIRYAGKITFSVNTRAKTRLGICKKTGDRYQIEIAACLLDENSPEVLLQETLLHELLHTCYGCMKHTGRWKALAERVNAAYGLHIARVTEADGLPKSASQPPRYRIVCPHCGMVYERYKRSPLVTNPSRYRCGTCKQPLG